MYRALTLYLIEHDIQLDDEIAIAQALPHIHIDFRNDTVWLNQMYLNDMNVEQKIRNIQVSRHVAQVAAFPSVRVCLLKQQKYLARDGWVVMDGRDMWSVIVPHAELKVHVVADLEIRARRRQEQLQRKGEIVDLATIQDNLRMRDEIDYDGPTPTSKISPDARVLDTSHTTIDEQIQRVVMRAQALIDT